jgi:putative intracellular protease/amidase
VIAVFIVLLTVFFGTLAGAKLAAVPAMREAATHLGFTVAQYRAVGVLELAGALGLLAGLRWASIGVAAGIGLVVLMLGAAAAHAAHRDPAARVAVPLLTGVVTAACVAALV